MKTHTKYNVLVVIMTHAYKRQQQQSNLAMAFQTTIELTVFYNLKKVKF